MKTEWKLVKQNSNYLVSNTGRVISLNYNNTGEIKELKPYVRMLNNKPYLSVIISYDGKKHTSSVHRLVAEAFIPNPNNYPCVNHKDEDPSNNNVNNLEWCTYEYNNTYKNRHLRNTRRNKGRPILQYDLDGNFIRELPSGMEASRKLNCSKTVIYNCANGKIESAFGYIWKWKTMR